MDENIVRCAYQLKSCSCFHHKIHRKTSYCNQKCSLADGKEKTCFPITDEELMIMRLEGATDLNEVICEPYFKMGKVCTCDACREDFGKNK